MTEHRSIGLVFHPAREQAFEVARKVAQWASGRGLRIRITEDERLLAGDLDDTEVAPSMEGVSLMVAVGGDGTVLRAVRTLEGSAVPVIGINVGYLGYLTRLEPDTATGFLDVWLDGEEARDWFVDDRKMVRGTAVSAEGEELGSFLGLNEIVLERKDSGHTVRLEVSIDGAMFSTFVADGLIVATPTGSTAYSMSVRGPVISPRVDALLLTPVSPHMTFDRSLVLDPTEVIQVKVVGQRSVSVAVDGRPELVLEPGDRFEFRGALHVARFIRFETMRFHQVLRAKFVTEGL